MIIQKHKYMEEIGLFAANKGNAYSLVSSSRYASAPSSVLVDNDTVINSDANLRVDVDLSILLSSFSLHISDGMMFTTGASLTLARMLEILSTGRTSLPTSIENENGETLVANRTLFDKDGEIVEETSPFVRFWTILLEYSDVVVDKLRLIDELFTMSTGDIIENNWEAASPLYAWTLKMRSDVSEVEIGNLPEGESYLADLAFAVLNVNAWDGGSSVRKISFLKEDSVVIVVRVVIENQIKTGIITFRQS